MTHAAHDAMLSRAEDAKDNAAIDPLEASIEKDGFAAATADDLPVGLAERLRAGEHPAPRLANASRLDAPGSGRGGRRLAELSDRDRDAAEARQS